MLGDSKTNLNFSISERKLLLFLIDHLMGIAGIVGYLYLLGKEDYFSYWVLFLAYLFISSFLNTVFKTYDIPIASSVERLNLVLFVNILIFSILFLVPAFTPRIPVDRLSALYLVSLLPVVVLLWRWLYIRVLHQPTLRTNTLIFGQEGCIAYTKSHFDFESHAYRIMGERVTNLENEMSEEALETFTRMVNLNKINTIILAYDNLNNMPPSVNRFIEDCSVRGVEIFNYLKFYEFTNYAIPISRLGNNLYLNFPFTRSNYNLIYKGLHRILDIVSAIVGLAFLSVLIPFILILNFFFNPGPLFFEQLRVGKGGIEIPILKLRSMVVDAEKKSGAVMATKNDTRITKFGKFLRKFRFDELPQFWAVLKGDMSLIGPRPERKVFVEQLKEKIPIYDMRHMVKPGITGWAQVKYKYGENLDDSYRKLEYDLYYIKYRSIILDIRIIIGTINTIIFSKGQ